MRAVAWADLPREVYIIDDKKSAIDFGYKL